MIYRDYMGAKEIRERLSKYVWSYLKYRGVDCVLSVINTLSSRFLPRIGVKFMIDGTKSASELSRLNRLREVCTSWGMNVYESVCFWSETRADVVTSYLRRRALSTSKLRFCTKVGVLARI